MLKKSLCRRISKFLALAMSLSVLFGIAGNSVIVSAANDCEITNPRIDEYGKATWDKVTFGSYYQDMTELEAEPVKWRILDIDSSGNAFLLADEVLECKKFNEKSVGEKTDSDGKTYPDYRCTWESSSLRAWLNGIGDYENDDTAFFNTAFTAKEQAAIYSTEVTNDEVPAYYTAPDPTTTDKVYLLSTSEASNAEYGFDTTVTEESRTRQAKATDHAYISGVKRSGLTDNYGSCNWWLRSFVGAGIDATGIRVEGNALNLGYGVEFKSNYGVRPALHINLSSSFIKDAGKVTSEGVVIRTSNRESSEYSKPVKADNGVTTWDCVYFGKYKQNVTFSKKPIEWRVLSVNGNDAFLLADKAIDSKPYNEKRKEGTEGKLNSDYACTWEASSVRAWLNGTGDYAGNSQAFINAAFDADEKKAITSTTIENDDNTTSDKVYLLSTGEITNSEYGFGNTHKKTDRTRTSLVTDYGYIKGAGRVKDPGYVGNCHWWLRSSGSSDIYAAYINFDGWVIDSGWHTIFDHYGVRPALHIDLSKINVKTAGTVNSYGVTTELTYIEQLSKDRAEEVDKLISDIDKVGEDSKAAIEAARKAYDELSEPAKARVTKLKELEEAEKTLGNQETQENGTGNENGSNQGNENDTHNIGNQKDKENTEDNSKGNAAGNKENINPVNDSSDNKVAGNALANSDNTKVQDNTTVNPDNNTTSAETTVTGKKIMAPGRSKVLELKSKKKKAFTVKWKRVNNSKGYELQYALNQKFTKSKKKVITSKRTLTVKSLKKNKMYYVRVRAYNAGSDGKKIYGKWSSIKRIKVKK